MKKTFKIALPGMVSAALAFFGGSKWLRNNLLHVPQAVLPAAAAQAGVTEEQWRAVEGVQAQIVESGITYQASRL